MQQYRASSGADLYSGKLAQAARVIRRGGIVAYPTESCYGLGCDPQNRRAIQRLLQIKRRPPKKGLILIAADFQQLTPYVSDVSPAILNTWPGPYTWLLPARPAVPELVLGQHPRVAVRVTAHPLAAALCRSAGMALISTSANRGGQHPAKDYRETVKRFGQSVDYILPGPIGKHRRPSTITDAVTGEVLRGG